MLHISTVDIRPLSQDTFELGYQTFTVLKAAQMCDCRVVDGLEMLINQGVICINRHQLLERADVTDPAVVCCTPKIEAWMK